MAGYRSDGGHNECNGWHYRISQSRDGRSAPEIYEGEITRCCEYQFLALNRICSDIDYSGYKRSGREDAISFAVGVRSGAY